MNRGSENEKFGIPSSLTRTHPLSRVIHLLVCPICKRLEVHPRQIRRLVFDVNAVNHRLHVPFTLRTQLGPR